MAKHVAWLLIATLALGVAASRASLADDDSPAQEATAASGDSQPDANRPYAFEYRFKVGEQIRSEVTQRTTIHTTMQGTTSTADMFCKSIKVWEVKDVSDDGVATFVHQVESVDMWHKMQGKQRVTYNSLTDTEVPDEFQDVSKRIGVALTTVTMDRFGKVLKRFDKLPQPTTMSTEFTMPVPSQPVVVGTTWSSPLEVDVEKEGKVKKIQTRQQYTLASVVDELATINVDFQILTPMNDPALEAQLIQKMTKGDVEFDLRTGRVVSQRFDLDRKVVGFSGPASSMHYVTHSTESLLPPTQQAARRAPRNSPVEAK